MVQKSGEGKILSLEEEVGGSYKDNKIQRRVDRTGEEEFLRGISEKKVYNRYTR